MTINYSTHCHVHIWWLGLVSVVGWDYCLRGVVSCITSTKRGRADVNDDSSDFIYSYQLATALGCARLDVVRTTAIMDHDDCERIRVSASTSDRMANSLDRKRFHSSDHS